MDNQEVISLKIEVTKLDEQDLRDLNHIIVAKLNAIQDSKNAQARNSFHVGEKVWFSKRGDMVHATITQINNKTIDITTNNGHQLRAAASLLNKISQ